jgi:hypothetical protein
LRPTPFLYYICVVNFPEICKNLQKETLAACVFYVLRYNFYMMSGFLGGGAKVAVADILAGIFTHSAPAVFIYTPPPPIQK